MHHPWRRLRDDWPDWQVQFVNLPDGVRGYTDQEIRTIFVSRSLNQAGRRSTLAHETEHVLRGHTSCDEREDELVELAAARLMLPIGELVSVFRWARNYTEAAEELWVDVDLLRCRIRHLDALERGAIQAAIMNRDEGETEHREGVA
jgi:hypothetical protein